MSRLKRNVVANYIGGTWTILMGVAFVPVYIHFLGVEAYGLIGVYVALQSWVALLDMGMTPMINREMARYSAGERDDHTIRSLLRTLEWIYVLIVLIIIGVAVALATPIVESGLRLEALDRTSAANAIRLIGVTLALRWFMGLYRGAVLGLQDQVWLSKALALLATFRGLGVIPVIAVVSPTVEAFFVFQLLTAACELIVVVRRTYTTLPPARTPVRFDRNELGSVWNFAAGVFGINVFATILMQADKILISAMLPLRFLGYYTLVASACSALSALTTPMINSGYPRMSELVAQGHNELLASTYHKLSQVLATVLIPAGIVISVFAPELLMLWTGNEDVALASAGVLTIFAIGSVLNGISSLPYFLQLAHGHTRLMLTLNAVAVLVLVPLLYWGIGRYGIIAGAYGWLGLNLGYICAGVPLMHRRYLERELARWMTHSVLVPLGLVAACCLSLRLLVGDPVFANWPQNILTLASASILAVAVGVLSTPLGRDKIRGVLSRHESPAGP